MVICNFCFKAISPRQSKTNRPACKGLMFATTLSRMTPSMTLNTTILSIISMINATLNLTSSVVFLSVVFFIVFLYH
jgi:hypothetical protein